MPSNPWDADPTSAEDAVRAFDDDQRILRSYIKVSGLLAPKFRELSAALETKRLALFADRIRERVDLLLDLSDLIDRARPLAPALEAAYDRVQEEAEEGRPPRAETFRELAAFRSLLAVAERMIAIEQTIADEDYRGYIDWTLDEYLGPDAVIYRRLQKVAPRHLWDSDYTGSRTVFGVLVYYSDPEGEAAYFSEERRSAQDDD